MIDVARLRKQIREFEDVLGDKRLCGYLPAVELEQLLAVFEAACAWRDSLCVPTKGLMTTIPALREAIDAARGGGK